MSVSFTSFKKINPVKKSGKLNNANITFIGSDQNDIFTKSIYKDIDYEKRSRLAEQERRSNECFYNLFSVDNYFPTLKFITENLDEGFMDLDTYLPTFMGIGRVALEKDDHRVAKVIYTNLLSKMMSREKEMNENKYTLKIYNAMFDLANNYPVKNKEKEVKELFDDVSLKNKTSILEAAQTMVDDLNSLDLE